ncbi:MAG: propanediol utilization protein [Candidatus Jacksonbacteria bacterium]|jgi:putative phosphotransacetylase|nr:propanediol utilization protein [Candidatus Jacksonbacteria bacterium]MBT6033997.1 propanediol utilization protein [Candidatus Jacksonbacteria bacterium]MBT6301552.1 propanediol utilization protein [Candidatus Jacksonbacteria bacterium]MBT6757483.1 propanediol utilization protein [Candidatus Jacksonbacteria bacterium]MBT6955404.1 propanediol utilization protein [Candidatus Jacksonbacteria bacterium]
MAMVPIEVSARHIHLSKEHADLLFGEAYVFTPVKELSQLHQFAYEEEIEIQTNQTFGLPECEAFTFGRRSGKNLVRFLGPVRKETQLELSQTDAFMLGITVPVKVSGDLDHTPGGIVLIGPNGQVVLEKGIIIPQRHIHCSTLNAKRHGLRNGQSVSVQVNNDSGLLFENVIVRVDPEFAWHMHLNTDEGNAAGISKGGEGEVLK